MADAVTFNYTLWLQSYPEFAVPAAKVTLPSTQAQDFFDMATGLWRNDGTSPNATTAEQTRLLNLLTAHMAKLFAPPTSGGQGAGLVGRINNAAEGSVSVQTEYASQVSDSLAFFSQTSYGALFWQLTAAYRMGPRYRAPYRNAAVVPGFPYSRRW